jgi:hypothetical protein
MPEDRVDQIMEFVRGVEKEVSKKEYIEDLEGLISCLEVELDAAQSGEEEEE